MVNRLFYFPPYYRIFLSWLENLESFNFWFFLCFSFTVLLIIYYNFYVYRNVNFLQYFYLFRQGVTEKGVLSLKKIEIHNVLIVYILNCWLFDFHWWSPIPFAKLSLNSTSTKTKAEVSLFSSFRQATQPPTRKSSDMELCLNSFSACWRADIRHRPSLYQPD